MDLWANSIKFKGKLTLHNFWTGHLIQLSFWHLSFLQHSIVLVKLVPITLDHWSLQEICSLSVSLSIVDAGCGDMDMDDWVSSESGVDNWQNISWGLWGGGVHPPLLVDVSVSMETSDGLFCMDEGVGTSCNLLLGPASWGCVPVGGSAGGSQLVVEDWSCCKNCSCSSSWSVTSNVRRIFELVLCTNIATPGIIHGWMCGGDQPLLLLELAEKIL